MSLKIGLTIFLIFNVIAQDKVRKKYRKLVLSTEKSYKKKLNDLTLTFEKQIKEIGSIRDRSTVLEFYQKIQNIKIQILNEENAAILKILDKYEEVSKFQKSYDPNFLNEKINYYNKKLSKSKSIVEENIENLADRYFYRQYRDQGICADDIDLNSPRKSMEHIKIRCQSGLGNCYAHAAAQMYDSYYKQKKQMPKNFHSSGFILSLNQYPDKSGSPKKSLTELFLRGTYEDRSFEDKLYQNRKKVDLKIFTEQIDQIVSTHFFNKSLIHYFRNFVFGKDYYLKKAAKETCEYLNQYPRIKNFLNYSQELIEDLLKRSTDTGNFLSNLFQQNKARKRLGQERPEIETIVPSNFKNHYGDNNILQKIEGHLNQNYSLPLGIGFCGNLFRNGSSFQGLSRNFDGKVIESSNCGGHIALITGRRKSQGICQYKITNSWSRSCHDYHADWYDRCKNGEIWIDQFDLLRNTYGLFNIQTF